MEKENMIKELEKYCETHCHNNELCCIAGLPCTKDRSGECNIEQWSNTNIIEAYKDLKKTAPDRFEDLLKSEINLYKLKNQKYGDSFHKSVEKYGLISALTRMSDKWNRIENLILNHDNGTEDESLIDSLKDLANYCNMTVIELEGKK